MLINVADIKDMINSNHKIEIIQTSKKEKRIKYDENCETESAFMFLYRFFEHWVLKEIKTYLCHFSSAWILNNFFNNIWKRIQFCDIYINIYIWYFIKKVH